MRKSASQPPLKSLPPSATEGDAAPPIEAQDIDATSRAAIFAHPARVQGLTNVPALMALLQKRAIDPTIFDERPPFFFRAEISSSRIDSYFTQMSTKTLANFAADAQAGVSFQDSHESDELGFGYSLDARFINASGNGIARTEADFYTIPGLSLNDVSTDDLIAGIRSGIVRDVSVGFYGGDYMCDVCGRNLMRDYDCPHVPGMEYDALTMGRVDAQTTKAVLATATIDDAHLAEVSAVYDGATPGAAILKAQQEVATGRMTPEGARMIETRYRIKLPGMRRFYAVNTDIPGVNVSVSLAQDDAPSTLEEQAMPTEPAAPTPTTLPEEIASLAREARAIADRSGRAVETDASALSFALEGLRRLPDLEKRIIEIEKRCADLEPKAAIGEQYRTDLIEATLAEGVRALGTAFNIEQNKAMLEGQGLEVIKAQRAQHLAVAESRFQGGRLTTDGEPTVAAPPSVPTHLYQA